MATSSIKWPCVAAIAAGLGAAIVVPQVVEMYSLLNATTYVSMAIFALSMALIWGYGGILCFGQAAFFGLGAYGYAVAGINFGDSTLAVPVMLFSPSVTGATNSKPWYGSWCGTRTAWTGDQRCRLGC